MRILIAAIGFCIVLGQAADAKPASPKSFITASQEFSRLPPLDRRPSSVQDLNRTFEAFALAMSGYWLSENLDWYVFATYDPIARILRWESSVPGDTYRADSFTVVQHELGTNRLRATEYLFRSRARSDFFLTDNTTLHANLRDFGVPRHLGFRLIDQNRLAMYNGAGGDIQHVLHRVLPGDPDGRLARAWATGGAQWSEAIQSVNEAERARQAAGGTNELFAFLGALAGGVIAGTQAGGDMTAISAGMAAGSAMTSLNSEIASAAGSNFDAERQRYEAEQEREREQQSQTNAAINEPNSPLTQQQAPAATPQSGQGLSLSSRTAADDGMRSHTTHAYFQTGLVPTAENTRNPRCYSTPFNITFTYDGTFVDGERAQAAAAEYVELFLAKCSQLGRVDSGTPLANIEDLTSGWPYPALHAEDKQVLIP